MKKTLEPKPNLCLCGCGTRVAAYFSRGHQWRVPDRQLVPIMQICEYCKKEFSKTDAKHRGRKQPFCTRQCSNAYRVQDLRTWHECAWCQTQFHRPLSSNGKSKLRYCSRDCRTAFFEARHAKGEGGIVGIRRWLKKTRGPQCESCGYSSVPELLIVHHLDGKESSNIPSNLKILCPTCHSEHHWMLTKKNSTTSPKSHGQMVTVNRSIAHGK